MGRTGGSPLIGRDAEWLVLSGALDQLTGGAGRMVWLEGEPGIGKSALVDALVAEATARRVTVLRGAGDEATQLLPLYLVAECVGVSAGSPGTVRAEIAELLGGGRGAGVLDPVLAASERVLELVDRLCSEGPLLLVTEDLQWADTASLAVWERMGRAVDQIPLLLVGTSRPATHRPEVGRLRDVVAERADVVLPVTSLDDAGVAELAERVLAARTGLDIAEELARCGGNPLFLRELLADLVREGRVETTEGTVRLRPGVSGVPGTLTATIRRRLSQLDPRTRAVLRTAALLGNEFDALELAQVTRKAADTLVEPLDQAVAEGILLEVGDRLAFRHALIRQVLEEELPVSMRRALHAQFARTLAEEGALVNAVVRHLLAVSGQLESWVARWLAGLPERMVFAEPRIAAQLLRQVLDPPVSGGEQREVLLARLVAVLFWLGDTAQAGELADEAVRAGGDPERNARMRLYRVRIASRMAENETALAAAAAAAADERVPEVWRARIRAWASLVLVKEGRFADAYQEAQLALADGTRLDDPLTAGYARHTLSHLGTGDAALAHIDAGLAGLGTDPDAVELRLLMLSNRLALLNNLGRQEEFHTTASQTLILASRVGAVRADRNSLPVAMGCYDFGAWDEALTHLDSMQSPLSAPVLIGRHGLAALIAAHREDWERLHKHVLATSAVPVTPGDVRIFSGYVVAAQAIRAEADGAPGRAVELLTRWLDPGLGIDAKERHMWLPELARLALAAGDTATARAAVAAADVDAAQLDALPRQRAAAQLCQGQLDDDVPLLRAAAEAYRRRGWTIGHAAALEEVAVRLARAGDLLAARATFTQTVRAYADLGATWDLRRADARLRAYGVRRGPRSLDRRPATGWGALTPTERRVAALVANGHSNPDIAAELYTSRRTVEAHVSHILGKLNVRSRMEIMKAFAAHC
ncbi:MAG TPA: AAA family ATPase [Streptosporangiaceae bacterium]|nr:AAA family ATPase [Streptosporangiaceae bacterium]